MALYISRQQLLACTLGYTGLISTLVGVNEDYAKRYGISVSKTNSNNLVMLKRKKTN